MQENEIIVLLFKQFSGEITARETQDLEVWLQQSAANADLARQYRTVWEKAGTTQKTFELDMDAEFRQLQKRLRTSSTPGRKVIPIGHRLLRLAAAVALLLTAVWGYRQFSTPPAEMQVLASNVDKRQVDLPDGTRVWLRKNATLAYPAEFNSGERRVKLQGEAYFEVAHNAKQPFRVELPQNGLIEVLGTRFNVQSLENSGQSVVLVREGSVRFSPVANNSGKVLSAGDRAAYNHAQAQLRLSKVTSFNELAWQTGGLEFVRTPLKDVIADLEKYYSVKIELRNPALKNCPHTAPLTNQPVEQVLESLSLTYQLQVSHPAPGQFILSGGLCN